MCYAVRFEMKKNEKQAGRCATAAAASPSPRANVTPITRIFLSLNPALTGTVRRVMIIKLTEE